MSDSQATMNFFMAQDRARRNTLYLVLAFIAGLAAMIIILYLLLHYFQHQNIPANINTINPDLLINVSFGVLIVVSIGSLFKLLALAAGGGAGVAQQLGGRLVSPATTNPDEKKLVNIVSEMALASGCPPPQIYIMPDSQINAFAAGSKPGNAVIGITRGALALPRPQVQGIIAHEFSHILNGDMRINMRVTGIIHGLMLFYYMGQYAMHACMYSHSRNSIQMFIPAIILVAFGFLGAVWGNIIRAAISRQREFLADAAAVQFTRNPEGIGGALQSIGAGSGIIQNPKAEECAHMFFSQGVKANLGGSTHPPLRVRIKRILPQWDGKFSLAAKPNLTNQQSIEDIQSASNAAKYGRAYLNENVASNLHAASESQSQPSQQQQHTTTAKQSGDNLPDLYAMVFGGKVAAANFAECTGNVDEKSLTAASALMSQQPILEDALTNSYSARAVVYAVLLNECSGNQQQAQLNHLSAHADNGVFELTQKIMPCVADLPHAARLPLLLRAVPTLRLLSPKQYNLFKQNMAALIAADGKVDLFEWSVQSALLHHLQNHFKVSESHSASTVPNLSNEEARDYVLSVIADAGSQDSKSALSKIYARYDSRPFSPELLSSAMRKMAKLNGTHKKHLLNDAAAIAAADNKLSGDEIALLRAFAVMLDCPLSLSLPSA